MKGVAEGAESIKDGRQVNVGVTQLRTVRLGALETAGGESA